MTVSIIVPCFNEKTTAEYLGSIFNSSKKRPEYILKSKKNNI